MVNKTILLILILLTINGVAFAGETSGLSVSMSASIFKKLNEFRAEPYKKIKEFAEKEKIANSLPVWVEDLNGVYLPQVNFNQILIKTSSAHLDDMANRNYFSEISPEGGGVSERLVSAGIDNQLSRESIGIVLFRNYIDPVVAEESVFKTIMRYELSKKNMGDTLVFNSAISEMAVSVKPSSFTVQGRLFNSYIAVIDGMKSENSSACVEISSKMSVLINQARLQPLSVLATSGIDAGSYVGLINEGNTFPSLFRIDYKEDEFAKYGINRLPESGYYVISKNNSGIESIINFKTSIKKDIQQSSEQDTVHIINQNNINLITENLFSELMKSELLPENQNRIIFNQNVNRIYLESFIVQGCKDDNIVSDVLLDMAVWNEASEQQNTSGVIFGDKDGDGLYDPGEERQREQILFFDKGIHARTDLSGGYYMNVDGLSFWLVIFDEEYGLRIHPNKNMVNNGFTLVDLNIK